MHKFHHEMLPTSFKGLFGKTAEVHCHNTRYATNQNYFMQQVSTNAGKKNSHRGATLWENVDQQFKDKSHNAFSNQYQSFLLLQYGWLSEKLYYCIHLVKFSIKMLSLHLSYVYAYFWHTFRIVRMVCNMALGILWQATEVFPWSLSQACFTVLRNGVFVYTFGNHWDVHCAGALRLDNRKVFRCPGCKVSLVLFFVLWISMTLHC